MVERTPPLTDTILVNRAMREGWPIDDETRVEAVKIAARIMTADGASIYHQLAAMRTLALFDSINARREANAIQERSAELSAGVTALREALAQPAGRDALTALSEVMCTPQISPIALPVPNETVIRANANATLAPPPEIQTPHISKGDDKRIGMEPVAEGDWGASFGRADEGE